MEFTAMSVFKLPAAAEFGLDAIDTEHREIADSINACVEMAAKVTTRLDLMLFHDLRQKMADHFLHEETIMQQAGFPWLSEHQAHHQKILVRLAALVTQCGDKGGIELVDLAAMFESLIDDVLRADLAFKTFLYEKNLLR
ncbi:MAG: hemerythrin domain-containing protein [Ferrovibrio sp.]|uniref:hemerythrin domain-containing protein n=1 Tax=Ferrovibrio sp. TaxID=1917215 RepID=UPI00391B3918